MPRRIEQEVRRNRRQIQRVESYYRIPTSEQSTGLSAPVATVELSVSGRLLTRPLDDTLIGGHPSQDQQSPRAVCGDRRGSWSEEDTLSGSVTATGRNALAKALTGAAIGLDGFTAGQETIGAWYDLQDDSSTRWLGDFRFNEFGDVSKVESVTSDGGVAVELSPDSGTLDLSDDVELKAELELSVSGASTGDVAITDFETLSDALASPTGGTGLDAIALGTDDSKPTSSDTELGDEVVEKSAGHDVSGDRVAPYTVVFKNEPDSQPHDIVELGVFDQDETLVWRATFGSETKDDRTTLRPRATLEIR